MTNLKMKCWNNEAKKWDGCSFPIFKGLNPVQVIGFRGEDDGEYLIKDGHKVVTYSGLKDKEGEELYAGDVLKADGYWDIYIVWDEENACFGFLNTDWVVSQGKIKPLAAIKHEIQNIYKKTGSIIENPEMLTSKRVWSSKK